MTETIAARFRRRAGAFARTIAQVPPERWGDPSPCDEWTALDVVRHVTTTQAIFPGLVDLPLFSTIDVDDDPLGAFLEATGQIQAHLEDPEVADKGYEGFFGPTTFAAAVDQFASFDLVVHRWDLATAAGLSVALDDVDIEQIQAQIASMSPEVEAAFRLPGVCGPALTAPEGSDAQTEVLAFLGRRAW